jgi:transposase
MLQIPGAWVAKVEFTPKVVLVVLRRRSRRRMVCPCGWSTTSHYDSSTRRWRHLDLGACRLFLEAEISRLYCRRCRRVRTEQVPWARPRARHTRDFEDVVCWLAQRTDKTTVSVLLRCSWRSVDSIVSRVVAEQLDEARLENLYRIGVDEFAYRKGHRYMTMVADHDTGAAVWLGEGKGKTPFLQFFDELGPERAAQLEAISMDLDPGFRAAADERAPQARQCFDPFHVVQMVTRAVDMVRASTTAQIQMSTQHRRSLRWAILKDRDRLTDAQRGAIAGLKKQRHILWRAWELKESLRDLYRLDDPAGARAYLKAWITRALRSRIRPIVLVARHFKEYFEGIVAAVELGLANSRLEGLNARVRLIVRRGYGLRSVASLIAMTYLCCGGIRVTLPTER